MKNRNIFIAIDGIDGVGKTTCSKMLAKKISAHYYRLPPKSFNKIKDKINLLRLLNIRFIFYLLLVIYSSIKIKGLLRTKSVICDRYIFSTLVYHRVLNIRLAKKISYKKLHLTKPDISIYLWADKRTRRQRLNSRKNNSTDNFIEQNHKLQNKIHAEFLKLPVQAINTTGLSPEEVCNKILKLAQKDD